MVISQKAEVQVTRRVTCTSAFCESLYPVAFLIFLPAAAGAGIVAANFVGLRLARGWSRAMRAGLSVLARAGSGTRDRPARGSGLTIAFSLAAGPGNVIDVGAQVARRFALGRGLLHSNGDVAAQELEQIIDDMMLDVGLQILEHAERFVFEFDERVALRYRAEVDTVADNVYGVDMIHPQAVDHLQRVRALKVANSGNAEAGILLNQCIKLCGAFFVVIRHQLGQFFDQVIFSHSVDIFRQQLVGYMDPDFQSGEHMRQLLFLVEDITGDIGIDDTLHLSAYHAQHALVQIGAFEYGAAVGIDHFALFSDHIVVFDDIFTGIEVVALYAGLRLFDEARDEATFERHIFVHARDLHHL